MVVAGRNPNMPTTHRRDENEAKSRKLLCHGSLAMIVSPDNYLYSEDGRYVWSPERVKAAWRQAMSHLDRYLANPRLNRVVLLVGIPASGKSTWLKANHDPNSLYFDATFTGVMARAPIIEAAKRAGKAVDAVVMNTPIGVCMDRNLCRPPDRIVPNDVIINMAVRLTEQPPTKAEGFDDIRYVKGGSATARSVMARYTARRASHRAATRDAAVRGSRPHACIE